MTRTEHAKIETNMKRQISRLNNKSKNSLLNLDEKLVIKRQVKAKKEALRQHILNFHELVS